MKPTVDVVICNYNGEKYLKSCLSTVIKTAYEKFQIIIIDDGSTDNSLTSIKQILRQEKRIIVIKNGNNIGLTRSRNKAIDKTKADVIVFLDNDTQVTKNWLSELVKTLYSAKNVGASQSVLVDYQKRSVLQHAGIKLISYTGWGAPILQGKSLKRVYKEEEIIALGAAMAVKREVAQKVGGFDEKLVHYTDDLDFSWRIWIAGYRILLSPKSVVFHWSKPVNEKRIENGSLENIYFHLAKNSFRTIMKNYEMKNLFKYLFWSILINNIRALLVLVKRHQLNALRATLRAEIWNIQNLRNTIINRKKTQKTRIYKDTYIIKKAMVSGTPLDIYQKYFAHTKLL